MKASNYILIAFISIISSFKSFSQTFSIGKFSIGETRIQVELDDFLIRNKNEKIKSRWIADSVQWIRNENNLLVPRARLQLEVPSNEPNIYFGQQNKIILPQNIGDRYTTQIYIELFNPQPIKIFSAEKLIDTILIEANSAKKARSKQLIDYSCSPYNLKIDGLDSEYISLGCKMERLGKIGSEHPRLEITFSSTNLKTLNNDPAPYSLFLEGESHSEIELRGIDQKIKTLKIDAFVPNRLYRFKTSLGFGPYLYQSKYLTGVQNSNLAPSFMLYGKIDLNETTSFKLFDALLYSKTLFNNSGVYFSYDLAEIFDGRILINTLLGFQGLHYKYSPATPAQFRLLYPQGFEVIYKHALIENYHLTYGMFFSTSSEQYTNSWLRYGKKSFIELNYINWGHEDSSIKMIGLSIGIPFFSAF